LLCKENFANSSPASSGANPGRSKTNRAFSRLPAPFLAAEKTQNTTRNKKQPKTSPAKTRDRRKIATESKPKQQACTRNLHLLGQTEQTIAT